MILKSDMGSVFWLSHKYLTKSGIREKAIERWKDRKRIERTYANGYVYINYDTIPAPTLAKLPSKEELKKEYNRQRHSETESYFFSELQAAYKGKRVSYYINTIQSNEQYSSIERKKVTEFARRASVLEKVLEIHSEYKCKGDLSALFYAFNTVYKDKYADKSRFLKVINKAKEKGILSVAIDNRLLRKVPEKYTDLHKYYAHFTLSHNKAFDIIDCYDIFAEACQKGAIQTPSFWWFREYYRNNKNLIDSNRNKQPKASPIYAKILPAENAGDQWQIDGWTIPVYCKKPKASGGWETFVRYTLFSVLDAKSRKIVGFRIAESENTETILKGLENAVKNTGSLPYEIVADNHAFNKTKESGYLKEALEEIGVHWTVDSNPRRKAIIERSFRTLGDKHFKKCYGYIGQGIRTKIKSGITQQELLDKYTKPDNLLTFDQLTAVVVSVVYNYNNSVIKKLKDTPNNLYKTSEKPNLIKVDDFKRIGLFIRKSEATIHSGQITIQRGLNKYEYQLPAKYYNDWNNKTVGIRYADFETLYLFELETDKPICSLPLKTNIHGAMANQTESDKEYLYKSAGRTKGIQSQSAKQKAKLTEGALTISSDAFGRINELTIPKDTLREIRQNYDMRNMLGDYDLSPDMINDFPKVNEMLDSSLKPARKDEQSPFACEKGTMEKIKINNI